MKPILKFLLIWNELWTLPLAFILWWMSPYLLHMVDPTAGTYDSGIFQVILFTIIQFMVYHAVAWIMLKITFPGIYRHIDEVLEKKITETPGMAYPDRHYTEWQKAKLSLFLFALYLLCIVMLSRIV